MEVFPESEGHLHKKWPMLQQKCMLPFDSLITSRGIKGIAMAWGIEAGH